MKRLTLLFCVILALAVVGSAYAQKGVFMGTAIRSLENPYHLVWSRGGQAYADSVGGIHVVQTCEGSSEKQLNDIKALIAKAGKNAVFCIDPNEAPNAVPIAKALEAAGVYYVTWWNKPDNIKAWNFPHWVAHIAFDGISTGEFTATELIKSMGGKGKIVAIQGMLANTTAIDRFQGLKNVLAKNPDVELVAQDTGEWDRNKAFDKMKSFLSANPDVGGVWCANDNMALGALEALRAAGLAGKVLVTGADGITEMLNAIDKGEAAATVLNDSFWQGGIGLSLAIAAKSGKINLKTTPKDHRQYYVQAIYINQDNIKQVIAEHVTGTPKYDWNDLYANYLRPMP